MSAAVSSSALSCASLLKAPRTLKENTWAVRLCQVHISMKLASMHFNNQMALIAGAESRRAIVYHL